MNMKEDEQMKQRREEEDIRYKSGISAIMDVKDFLDVFLYTHTHIQIKL